MRAEMRSKLLATAVPLLALYAKRIVVFGSVARGEEQPDSDIDLLVELRDQAPAIGLLGWLKLERELSERLGRRVEMASKLKAVVREEAEKDMVVLYEG